MMHKNCKKKAEALFAKYEPLNSHIHAKNRKKKTFYVIFSWGKEIGNLADNL